MHHCYSLIGCFHPFYGSNFYESLLSIFWLISEEMCVCDTYFKGHDCSQIDCPGEPDCLDRGSCVFKNDTAICLCEAGFAGDNCSAIVCPGDPECNDRGREHLITFTGKMMVNSYFVGADTERYVNIHSVILTVY